MDPNDTINDTLEVISFGNTLEEIDRVITGGPTGDQMILVHLINMYEEITEFGWMVGVGRTAMSIVNTRLWTRRCD